jgi:hypothetical protein
MFFEYLSPAIAAASRGAESFAYIFHIPAMIPESKCAFLDIFAGPPVDHDVDSYGEIRAEQLLAPGIRPLRLGRDFSVISCLATRATKNHTIPIILANSCNASIHDCAFQDRANHRWVPMTNNINWTLHLYKKKKEWLVPHE